MIIGIDEVGRGCWAGPLVAAAVGLPTDHSIKDLNDSKKLTAKKRLQLTKEIKNSTETIGLGWVWPKEINTLGLTESVRLAMQRAVDGLNVAGCKIIIDGNINYLAHLENTSAIIKADGTLPEVSAASIVAKVARDLYMAEIALKYPQYGFDSHVGYGTQQHIKALEKHGILPIHRLNYKPIRRLVVDSQ